MEIIDLFYLCLTHICLPSLLQGAQGAAHKSVLPFYRPNNRVKWVNQADVISPIREPRA